jgi:hypothetical protein
MPQCFAFPLLFSKTYSNSTVHNIVLLVAASTVGYSFSYLKAREDSGLKVRDIEGRNDNVCQRPVQPQVAKVSTKKRVEVLAVVLRPNHHSQSAGDLGEDPVPASFSEHWHFERQETKVLGPISIVCCHVAYFCGKILGE